MFTHALPLNLKSMPRNGQHNIEIVLQEEIKLENQNPKPHTYSYKYAHAHDCTALT